MSNTIELLNNIGSDASLRHATSEDLQRMLSGMDASEGLKQTAMSGDKSFLVQELGAKANLAIEVNQNPHNSGSGFEEGDDNDSPQREDDDTGGVDNPTS